MIGFPLENSSSNSISEELEREKPRSPEENEDAVAIVQMK